MRLAPLALMMVTIAAPAAPAAARGAEDVSGTWTIDGDIQGNAFTLNCTVQQSPEARLSGQCDANGTSSELTGTAKDADVQFSVTLSGYTLTYTGKVAGDALSGGIQVAGTSGTFTGKRGKG